MNVVPGSPNPFVTGMADPRQALLKRMGDKLAGKSRKHIEKEEWRQEAKRQMAWSRGWRILSLAVIIGLSALLVRFRDDIIAPATKPVSRISRLEPLPAKMPADRQLLFWVYALYDADRFKSEFGVGSNKVIDARMAKAEIQRLRPQAGRQAQFVAEYYRTNMGRVR